jgi:hypothetical protein
MFRVITCSSINCLHSKTILLDIHVDKNKIMADSLLNIRRDIMSTFASPKAIISEQEVNPEHAKEHVVARMQE